jgi:hypothetical protein
VVERYENTYRLVAELLGELSVGSAQLLELHRLTSTMRVLNLNGAYATLALAELPDIWEGFGHCEQSNTAAI